jgi:hypothetical protein
MPTVTGHVFVVPGTLQALLCDDILISSDFRAGNGIGPHFWSVFGWTHDEGPAQRQSLGPYPSGRRIFLAEGEWDADGRRRWVVDVGADEKTEVSWLIEGVREAFETVAGYGDGALIDGRPRRIAMPVMGVGRGGFNGRRGEVIHSLLREAQRAADQFGIDVVIVAARASDYSAFQLLRTRQHVIKLSAGLEEHAQRLAELARAGRLAVFMGAGTGIAAGLPSWDQLLGRLAAEVGITDTEGLGELGPLDAAELVRRKANGARGSSGGDKLGEYVAKEIGEPTRYALSHAFLAALNADQVITTNFDRLYELPVESVPGTQPVVVLPESDPADLRTRGYGKSWLLKLHGDIKDRSSIVLDRRSFVRYDARRRPLGGVLQTTLLTRHLLVVGASMTDDNVIRLIHEVSELIENRRQAPALGTVLSLRADPLRSELWQPEFEFLDLSAGSGDMKSAARELEIFLDRVAMLAAPRAAHLLDPRYRELLDTDEEKQLAARAADLAREIRSVPSGAAEGWRALAQALEAWGAPTDE